MPSRKKNKGRERKARKEDSKIMRGLAHWGEDNEQINCNHGHELSIPAKEHPVPTFINSFCAEVEKGRDNVDDIIRGLLRQLPRVLVEDNRKMTINILLSMGTNILLYQKSESLIGPFDVSDLERHITCLILVLENYGELEDVYSAIYNQTCAAKSCIICKCNKR